MEERFPIRVVAGYVASAHDFYVNRKYACTDRLESFIPWEERVKLIDLALKGHPWIRTDKWDGNEELFYEYFDTQKSFMLFLDAWCEEMGFTRAHASPEFILILVQVPKILMVAGADLVNKCHLERWYSQKGLGCVCVERPGYSLPEILTPQEQLQKRFFVLQVSLIVLHILHVVTNLSQLPQEYIDKYGTEDVSSTQVQELLKSGNPEDHATVSRLLHPDVEAELRKMWNVRK